MRKSPVNGSIFRRRPLYYFGTSVLQNFQQIYICDQPKTEPATFIELVMHRGQAYYNVWLDLSSKHIPYAVRTD